MGITGDFHLHTSFSSDSEAPMASMIEQGISAGLSYLCITEHMDKDYVRRAPMDPDFEVDTDAYYATYQALRTRYEGQIEVLFGIELGLQPHVADFYRKYIVDYPFDFILGSSHLCHRKDPYFPDFYEGRPEEEAYREYFESILENIYSFDGFDVYGHLDYAVRYGPNQDRFYSYEKYAELLDSILHELIKRGKGIEINTGGFRYGLAHPNPTEDILRRYLALNGEIITIGSDAHRPEHIAYEFDRVSSILKECGFKYYTIFKNRTAEFVKL